MLQVCAAEGEAHTSTTEREATLTVTKFSPLILPSMIRTKSPGRALRANGKSILSFALHIEEGVIS